MKVNRKSSTPYLSRCAKVGSMGRQVRTRVVRVSCWFGRWSLVIRCSYPVPILSSRPRPWTHLVAFGSKKPKKLHPQPRSKSPRRFSRHALLRQELGGEAHEGDGLGEAERVVDRALGQRAEARGRGMLIHVRRRGMEGVACSAAHASYRPLHAVAACLTLPELGHHLIRQIEKQRLRTGFGLGAPGLGPIPTICTSFSRGPVAVLSSLSPIRTVG